MTAVIAERASSLAKRSVSRVYRVRHAKRADIKYPTSAGKKNPDLIKSGLRGEQKNASIDLNLYALDSLNIQCE